MKKKNIYYSVLLFLTSSILFAACGEKISLTNDEAKLLIETALKLPQKYRSEVNGGNIDWLGENHPAYQLEQEGYIIVKLDRFMGVMQDCNLSVTEKGRQYYLGEGRKRNGSNTLLFKTVDIDFGEITGIAINKEEKTATVRFTLKAINISPIGRILEKNIDNPRSAELVFKKFDNGWQLADQNVAGAEYIRSIYWPAKN